MAAYSPRYDQKANTLYRLKEIDQLDDKTLKFFIEDFTTIQKPRLDLLMNYYLNYTPIKVREGRDVTRADNRLSHNFARYISTVVQGYMLGNPIRYKHSDETLLTQIEDFGKLNNEHAHNSVLEMNLSIYGRAYEIAYRDEESEEKIAILDPKEVFVIYDTSVAYKPLAAVHLYSIQVQDKIQRYCDVYKETGITKYEGKEWKSLKNVGDELHYFEKVPIIEYWNNDERIGDFEPILDLIDAYDIIQSDTANEIEDFASAYLVLQGQPNTEPEDVAEMKKNRVLVLDQSIDGSTPSAYYLVKQYDVAGQEAMKNRIVNDIHKLSFVPDLSDEQFSSNVSGEAMKYKLFVFDQLRMTKERLFRDGIMRRYRVIAGSWGIKQKVDEIENVEVVFSPNLPKNTKELVEVATMLEGLVSKETQLGLLPMVENVEDELDRVEAEQDKAAEKNELAYKQLELNLNNTNPVSGGADGKPTE